MTSNFDIDGIRQLAEEKKRRDAQIKAEIETRQIAAQQQSENFNQLIQHLLNSLINQLGWTALSPVKHYEKISTKFDFIGSHLSGRSWQINFRDDSNRQDSLYVYLIDAQEFFRAAKDIPVYDWGRLVFTVPASPLAKMYASLLSPNSPAVICKLGKHFTETQDTSPEAIKNKLSELIVKYLSDR